MSYRDDEDNGEGLAFLIIAFIVLTPVIPAGDIGLHFASVMMNGKPIVIVNIISWAGAIFIYSSILYGLYKLLHLTWWLFIPLVYAQGIYFANLIKDTPYNHFSHIVAMGWNSIYTFLTSPA